jgi:hypothetical protein
MTSRARGAGVAGNVEAMDVRRQQRIMVAIAAGVVVLTILALVAFELAFDVTTATT